MPGDGQLRHQMSYGVHDACRHKSEEARTSRPLPTTDVTPAWRLLMDSLPSPLPGRHSAYRTARWSLTRQLVVHATQNSSVDLPR